MSSQVPTTEPEPLSMRAIGPRIFVALDRISQVFHPSKILRRGSGRMTKPRDRVISSGIGVAGARLLTRRFMGGAPFGCPLAP